MPSIDERVVAMAFENAKFETAIAQTMKTLDQLNKALASVGAQSGFDKLEGAANKVTLQGPMSALDKLKQKLGMSVDTKPITDIEGAANKVTLQEPMSALDKLRQKLGFVGDTQGFSDIEKAANQVDFTNLSQSVDGVGGRFTALQSVAFGVFASIGAKITGLATHVTHMFGLGPVIDGFHNYENQIDAVQVIMANTGLTGKKGLGQIETALHQLNQYANLTIYNFSEMAKNIGTFTAAGVQLKPAVAAIKGIANLGALSGSTSAQVSSAMYQLSQALAAGQIHLQDWNSVVNAQMGGRRFQQMLLETGIAMGKLNANQVEFGKQIKVNGGTFRESLMTPGGIPSWLTSDVLSQSLQNFTGDMTAAQLKAKGYNDAAVKDILNTAKLANQSATQIKTFSQMMQALKEETASSWAQLWKVLFGNLPDAKRLFSPLHIAIENMLRNPIDAFTKQLQGWSKLGGRTMLFKALEQGFKNLGQIIHVIHQAFRDIFPPQTSKGLLEMTKHFSHFIDTMKASPQTLDNIRKTFRGFFAVLSIGWYIVKKVAGVILNLLGVAKGGAGGFLAITGGIGDFLTGLQTAIVKGDALAGFFKGITKILTAPLSLITNVAHAISNLFSGVDTKSASNVTGAIGSITSQLPPLNQFLKKAGQIGKRIVNTVNAVFNPISKAVSWLGHALVNIGQSIANTFEHANFDNVFGAIQTALAGGIFLAIKKALGQPINLVGGIGSTLDRVKSVLGGMTESLRQMQHLLKAATLLAIGAAIVALAVGIKVLAGIDPKRLTMAMTAVGIGLGQLVAAMALFAKMPNSGPSLLAIGAGMVGVATAVTILAIAMKIMATIPEKKMERALTGIAIALLSVGAATKLMGPELSLTAPGIIATAFALVILAGAVKLFGSMSWAELGKGLVGVIVSVTALTAAFMLLAAAGPGVIAGGAAMVIASAGLLLLAGAVAAFGNMDTLKLIQGLIGINAAIVTLGVAIWALPPTLLLQAAGLIVLGAGLVALAGGVDAFGSMSVGTLAKGIIAMGIAVGELAVGLTLMIAALPGTVALLGAAAAFAVLAPAIGILGSLSWGTIVKGLVAMAGVLGVLGVVGGVASIGLIALGVGLTMVGVGVMAIGAGIYLIVKALVLLGDESIRSTGVLIAAISAFIAVIPKMIVEFVKGMISTMSQVADLAPKIVQSLSKIVLIVLDTIIKILPKLKELVDKLMLMFIDEVNNHSMDFINAGWKLLLNFLTGIDKNIKTVIDKGASIVIKFLTGLANHAPAILNAGYHLIVTYLNGVTRNLPSVLTAAGRLIATFITGVANQIPRIVLAGVRILTKFMDGLAKAIPRVRKSAIHLMRVFLNNVSKASLQVVDTAFTVVIRFLNGLAKSIRKHSGDLRAAGMHLLGAVLDGITFGMAGHVWNIGKSVIGFFKDAVTGGSKHISFKPAVNNIKHGLNLMDNAIGVPKPGSKKKHHAHGKAIADNIGQGFRKGLADNGMGIGKTNPVITPVVDLTHVNAAGKKIRGTLGGSPKLSLAHAASISRSTAHRTAAAHTTPQQLTKEIKFEQNIRAPASLSTREIYRRTHNQLSRAKHKLGLIDGGVLLAGE